MTSVGKGKPPLATRFKAGQSGNPNGRPRGRHRTLPYDSILGQMVTVIEGGREHRIKADEAFLLHIAKTGIAGGGSTSRTALAALERARERRGEADGPSVSSIVTVPVGPGEVASALRPLRMATLLDPYRTTGKLLLEPWLVQAALERLGTRRLSLQGQRTIEEATRTPHKVRWPAWWGTDLR